MAKDEYSVSKLYQNQTIADEYVEKRFNFSWQRLLHAKQVQFIETAVNLYSPVNILELAPGPARISVDLNCITKGYMIENSQAMIDVAKKKLKEKGTLGLWEIFQGNAFELDKFDTILEKMDLIYTFRFIRHFHKADRVRLYESMKRMLTTGGLFLLDVVNKPLRLKLEKKIQPLPDDALPVYDVTYTKEEFVNEMDENGFDVISFEPVLTNFEIQKFISIKFYDIFPALEEKLVNALERIPLSQPLEWLALCKKQRTQ